MSERGPTETSRSGGADEAGARRAPSSPPRATFGRLFTTLRRRAEFGDFVLLLYVVAVVRQYAWAVADNRAAWAATAAVSAAVWACFVASKREADDERATPSAFWPLVLLPLGLVYAARVALPDTSYDVLNYHIFQGERSLRHAFYAPGDFFPTIVPFNPTPDIVQALTRRTLGYRLGTVVNLLALVWAAQSAEKLLRPFVARALPRCAGVLAAVWAEQLLFEVNNYMVDLLPLPLVLEATRITLRRCGVAGRDSGGARHRSGGASARPDDARRDLLRVAFLLGLAMAFKITNLAAVVALAPLWARRLFAGRTRPSPARLAASLAAASALFVLSILPYSVLMYRLTGSALFPMYNGVFRSPYWGAHSGWDARFGPRALWEKPLWPLLLPFAPARFSELGLYSGRITLGFAAALAALLLARRRARTRDSSEAPPHGPPGAHAFDESGALLGDSSGARLRDLSVVFVVGALAWSFVIGYSRYGLHLELLGGVIVVALLSNLAPGGASRARRAVAAAFAVGLAAQLSLAGYKIWRDEWSLRPVAFREPAAHAADAAHLLRDHSLRGFLAPEELAKVDQVGVWIESGVRTSAVGVMLRPDAPTVGVRNYEHFASRPAVERYFAALDAAEGRRMFSLCFPADADSCARAIKDHGLAVVGSTRLRVPYYSPRNVFEIDLLEVRRGEPGPLLLAHLRQLPPGGYRARIEALDAPAALKAGALARVRVRVSNVGAAAWPAGRPEGGAFQVNLGGRWLRADGETPVREVAARATMPRDARPGDVLELSLPVDAPAEPGDYVLQLDMVHEAVTWFYQQDSEPLLLRVRVEP